MCFQHLWVFFRHSNFFSSWFVQSFVVFFSFSVFNWNCFFFVRFANRTEFFIKQMSFICFFSGRQKIFAFDNIQNGDENKADLGYNEGKASLSYRNDFSRILYLALSCLSIKYLFEHFHFVVYFQIFSSFILFARRYFNCSIGTLTVSITADNFFSISIDTRGIRLRLSAINRNNVCVCIQFIAVSI